jgi:hypothetical protein
MLVGANDRKHDVRSNHAQLAGLCGTVIKRELRRQKAWAHQPGWTRAQRSLKEMLS